MKNCWSCLNLLQVWSIMIESLTSAVAPAAFLLGNWQELMLRPRESTKWLLVSPTNPRILIECLFLKEKGGEDLSAQERWTVSFKSKLFLPPSFKRKFLSSLLSLKNLSSIAKLFICFGPLDNGLAKDVAMGKKWTTILPIISWLKPSSFVWTLLISKRLFCSSGRIK